MLRTSEYTSCFSKSTIAYLAVLLSCLLLPTNSSFAQKQGNIWYFGEGAGLDFNSGTAVPIAGGQVFGNPQLMGDNQYNEGCATISDSAGGLLFYSNGENVWNSNHQVMPNGDSLMGFYSSTHAAFIVPQPLSDSKFYVFTTDGLERNLEDGLRYSVVDMCLDNGLGGIDPDQKNILLLDTVSKKIAAINHQNGKDIWLIAHKYNSDAFYSYQISENGIIDTVITNIGSVHGGTGFYSAIGQMKPSPDGNKIALVFSNVNPAVAEVFGFDKATGILSNPISLVTDNGEYGVEFSPDNSKLYVTNFSGLHQFDLSAGGGLEAAINASKTTISSGGCIPNGIQLGPDGKIYVSRCTDYIAAIQNPNAYGASCNFTDSIISFGGISTRITGFPSFIQGYEYRNGTFDCEVAGIDDITSSLQYKLYPNPASEHVTLVVNNLTHPKYSVNILDSRGRVVMKKINVNTSKLHLDVGILTRGVYFLQIMNEEETFLTERLIVQ